MWLHSWFAGAALVTPENSMAIFFEQTAPPWTLTSHGRQGAEVSVSCASTSEASPGTPVANRCWTIWLGLNGYMDKPWGILQPTAADREVRDLIRPSTFW